MANQVYFNGNFYQVITATNAGESPATNPEKFALIQIPKPWRETLTQLAYEKLLKLSGLSDKALEEETQPSGNNGQGLLDELMRRDANQNKWRERPTVNC